MVAVAVAGGGVGGEVGLEEGEGGLEGELPVAVGVEGLAGEEGDVAGGRVVGGEDPLGGAAELLDEGAVLRARSLCGRNRAPCRFRK